MDHLHLSTRSFQIYGVVSQEKQIRNLSIIPLSEKDINSIVEIERISFTNPWSPDSFLSEINHKDSYNYGVAFIDRLHYRQIVAYISYRLIDTEMHLMKIAVVPQYRGQGIATWLLEKCLKACINSGIGVFLLEVRPSNGPAIKLYNKLGFEIIGRRPGYYSDTREDALIMCCQIQKEEP